MSDAEGDGVSDVELDDDFDDFDPLVGEDEDGGASQAEDSDDDAEDGEDAEEGDGDAAETASVASSLRPSRPRGRTRPADMKRAKPPSSGSGFLPVEARKRIIVSPEDRVTSNMLTLAETTRAIAIRAEQIAAHPNIYTDTGGLTDPKDIARKEFLDRRSPLVLYRDVGRTPAGERVTEEWFVREMSYPPLN